VFEEVGGFRNGIGRVGDYPMGGEETELCIRAAKHWPDKVFLCDPCARIHHQIPPYRASWRYFCVRCYAEGLSKAIMSKYVGVKDSLSSERTYTLKMLPRGLLRGITDSLFRFDPTGILRAGAMLSGFAITTFGYLVQTLSQRLAFDQKTSVSTNTDLFFQIIPTPKEDGRAYTERSVKDRKLRIYRVSRLIQRLGR
jgi:hypothetical protein